MPNITFAPDAALAIHTLKCFKPPVIYSTDSFKAVVPVLVLLFLLVCGLFYEAICFMSCLCYFVLVVFSLFSIAITSLREE